VTALHDWFGVPVPSQSLTPGVQTALFDHEGGRVLVVVNNGEETTAARIALDVPGAEGREPMVVDVAGKSGVVVIP
jgi:hypothetical protein